MFRYVKVTQYQPVRPFNAGLLQKQERCEMSWMTASYCETRVREFGRGSERVEYITVKLGLHLRKTLNTWEVFV